MLPKHTNKVQLGINIRMVSYNGGKNQITNECIYCLCPQHVLFTCFFFIITKGVHILLVLEIEVKIHYNYNLSAHLSPLWAALHQSIMSSRQRCVRAMAHAFLYKNKRSLLRLFTTYPAGLITDCISSLLIRRLRSALLIIGCGRLQKTKSSIMSIIALETVPSVPLISVLLVPTLSLSVHLISVKMLLKLPKNKFTRYKNKV